MFLSRPVKSESPTVYQYPSVIDHDLVDLCSTYRETKRVQQSRYTREVCPITPKGMTYHRNPLRLTTMPPSPQVRFHKVEYRVEVVEITGSESFCKWRWKWCKTTNFRWTVKWVLFFLSLIWWKILTSKIFSDTLFSLFYRNLIWQTMC